MCPQEKTIHLGPLEPLVEDPEVLEIMVNRWNSVFVERNHRLEEVPDVFHSQDDLLRVVETLRGLVETRGLLLDVKNPIADIRLGDAARCHVVLPPIAPEGPTITLRKFHQFRLTADDLLRFGSWNDDMVRFLRACVVGRLNIVVSGGTGAGKTSVLNILTGMIPASERIITVERALELQPPEHLKHIVRLETRPPDQEGQGEVTIRDLVINAMHMRPDRLIMGEVHGGEALDMLQAMTTGHDGSMFSIHGIGPHDVLLRLETMVAMNNLVLPLLSVRRLIADAIHLITYQERMADGRRRIVKIAEVAGMQGDTLLLHDLFEFRDTGVDEQGQVQGYFTATGHIPSFLERFRSSHIKALLQAEGIDLPLSLFEPKGERA